MSDCVYVVGHSCSSNDIISVIPLYQGPEPFPNLGLHSALLIIESCEWQFIETSCQCIQDVTNLLQTGSHVTQ